MSETRERIYYLIDDDTKENIMKRPDFDECLKEARKLNDKEGRKRYRCKGAWAIHINRG